MGFSRQLNAILLHLPKQRRTVKHFWEKKIESDREMEKKRPMDLFFFHNIWKKKKTKRKRIISNYFFFLDYLISLLPLFWKKKKNSQIFLLTYFFQEIPRPRNYVSILEITIFGCTMNFNCH